VFVNFKGDVMERIACVYTYTICLNECFGRPLCVLAAVSPDGHAPVHLRAPMARCLALPIGRGQVGCINRRAMAEKKELEKENHCERACLIVCEKLLNSEF
jgi:hypothetical protein